LRAHSFAANLDATEHDVRVPPHKHFKRRGLPRENFARVFAKGARREIFQQRVHEFAAEDDSFAIFARRQVFFPRYFFVGDFRDEGRHLFFFQDGLEVREATHFEVRGFEGVRQQEKRAEFFREDSFDANFRAIEERARGRIKTDKIVFSFRKATVRALPAHFFGGEFGAPKRIFDKQQFDSVVLSELFRAKKHFLLGRIRPKLDATSFQEATAATTLLRGVQAGFGEH
jgi:hypothetical protein